MRPLIGITTYREPARWGTWDIPAVLLPAAYADAVAGAGGEPVLLPTGATGLDVLPRLDGLVLAGGADVEPARYGQPTGPHTAVVRPDRDAAELALLTRGAGAGRAAAGDLPRACSCSTWCWAASSCSTCRTCRAPAATTRAPGSSSSAKCGSMPGSDLRGPAGDDGARALPPPPGARPDRRRSHRDRVGRGRRRRGRRTARTRVLPGRPVAPRGRRGPPAVHRARGRGRSRSGGPMIESPCGRATRRPYVPALTQTPPSVIS